MTMKGERKRGDADANHAGPCRSPRTGPSTMALVLVGMNRVVNGGPNLVFEGTFARLPIGTLVAHVLIPTALAFAAPFPAREFRLLVLLGLAVPAFTACSVRGVIRSCLAFRLRIRMRRQILKREVLADRDADLVDD
jgi:hypothetical protein